MITDVEGIVTFGEVIPSYMYLLSNMLRMNGLMCEMCVEGTEVEGDVHTMKDMFTLTCNSCQDALVLEQKYYQNLGVTFQGLCYKFVQ